MRTKQQGFTLLELLVASVLGAIILTICLSAIAWLKPSVLRLQQRAQLVNEAVYLAQWLRTNLSTEGCAPAKVDGAVHKSRLIWGRGSHKCVTWSLYVAKSAAGAPTLYRKIGTKRAVALSSLLQSMQVQVYPGKQKQVLHLQLLLHAQVQVAPWRHVYYFAGEQVVTNNYVYFPVSIWVEHTW